MIFKTSSVRFLSVFAVVVFALTFFSCEKPFAENGADGDSGGVVDKDDDTTEGGGEGKATVKFNIIGVEEADFFDMEQNVRSAKSLKDVCKRLSYSYFDRHDERINSKTITQLRDDDDFGKANFVLPKGSYSFVFIAENNAEAPTISKVDSVSFKGNKLSDTFYYYAQITVKGNASYDIVLKRAVAKIRVTLNDAVPADVNQIEFQFTGGSSTFDAVKGYGCKNSRQTVKCDVAHEAHFGKSVYELYTFPHDDDRKIKLTVTAKDGDSELYKSIIDNIKVERGATTYCSLDLFGEAPEGGR